MIDFNFLQKSSNCYNYILSKNLLKILVKVPKENYVWTWTLRYQARTARKMHNLKIHDEKCREKFHDFQDCPKTTTTWVLQV